MPPSDNLTVLMEAIDRYVNATVALRLAEEKNKPPLEAETAQPTSRQVAQSVFDAALAQRQARTALRDALAPLV